MKYRGYKYEINLHHRGFLFSMYLKKNSVINKKTTKEQLIFLRQLPYSPMLTKDKDGTNCKIIAVIPEPNDAEEIIDIVIKKENNENLNPWTPNSGLSA